MKAAALYVLARSCLAFADEAPPVGSQNLRCEPGFVSLRGSCIAARRLAGPHDERCDPPCAIGEVCGDKARCGTPLRATPPGASEPADGPRRYQIGGRFGVGPGFDHGFYGLVQTEAAYRVLPEVLVVGVFEAGFGDGVGHSCHDGGNCPPNYVGLGPRIELSPVPESVFGMWLGGGVAVDHLYRSKSGGVPPSTFFVPFVLESTWDFGLELRPSRGLAIGVGLAAKFFLTEPYEYIPPSVDDDAHRIISLQLRVAGRF